MGYYEVEVDRPGSDPVRYFLDGSLWFFVGFFLFFLFFLQIHGCQILEIVHRHSRGGLPPVRAALEK